MTVEIISLSISMKVWDRAGIELVTPGSAVRQDFHMNLKHVCQTSLSLELQQFYIKLLKLT